MNARSDCLFVRLSESDLQEVQAAYAAGADAFQVRAKWQPDDLAQIERWRIENDPDGYGKTWQPYMTLGGIEWHGGRHEAALEHYRRAQANGATMREIGSQLCDTLMHVGAYAEAQALSKELMAEGPNEWRDVFLEAILYELVDELGLKQQRRRQRRHGEYSIRVTRKAARAAWRHIRKRDALDRLSWDVLGHSIDKRSRFTSILATAYWETLLPHGWP